MRAQLTIALAALLVAASPAQDEKKKQEPAWPKLSRSDTSKMTRALRNLGKKEAVASKAEATIQGLGAGVGPRLIGQLGAKRPQNAETIRRILDATISAEYVPLLKPHAKSDSVLVRQFVVDKLLQHPAEANAETLTALTADKDADIAFRASLGLVGMGKADALEQVFEACHEDWRAKAEVVSKALSPQRSNKMAQKLVDMMPRDDEQARVTGLRLMRSLAPKSYANVIATYLDAQQHSVKKEAINALRAVVDGEAPLENLSVFQAIDQAKKWKARIQ